jgi:hypothetical protein
MAAVAKTLVQVQNVTRDLYLFDTFEGMTKPTDEDVDYSGKQASTIMIEDFGYRCADAPLDESGVIVVDDYGHWEGARRACNEYFAQNCIPILLNRIDYTGRIGFKP